MNNNKCSILPFIDDQFIDVDNLWRSTKTSVNELGDLKIGKRVITFLKTTKGSSNLLGKVKWLGQINNVNCVGIDLDEPYKFGNSGKLDNKNKFEATKKHGVFTPITNVKPVTDYIEAAVPCDLKTSKNIDIHSTVKVYRLTSNDQFEKVYGTVVWSGYNDSMKYLFGIKLNLPVPDGTDGSFSHQRLFYCKPKLGVLVPVGMVKYYEHKNNSDTKNEELLFMENEKYQSIIKMLLAYGDVNKLNEKDETIFDIAKKIGDESFLHSMLGNCQQILELSHTKCMEMILIDLVESDKWNLLFRILKRAKVDERSNKYLLFLCISVLKKQNSIEKCNEIISICLDKNAVLHNGETFLTSLLKSDITSSTMVNIMNKKLFDIDKPNLSKETPLVLACKYLLVDVVKLLIGLNCDIKYYKNQAIEAAVLAKNKASDQKNMSKVNDGSKIIQLLSESNDSKELYLCQICMDKNRNTALNCGHILCSICATKVTQCPYCNLPIQNSLKIFL